MGIIKPYEIPWWRMKQGWSITKLAEKRRKGAIKIEEMMYA